mmetsp:Transcript_48708/g.112886  ORF Transcript_48708/g.112886 Transcript_48708/m.112886 type:complete len:242 (+) Transcript_48708:516-1241(+)
MRREQHSLICATALDAGPELPLHHHVDSSGWLVHEHKARLVDQGDADGESSLHPSAVVTDWPVCIFGPQLDVPQHSVNLILQSALRYTLHAAVEGQVIATRDRIPKVCVVLQTHAKLTVEKSETLCGNVFPTDKHAASRRGPQFAGETSECCRLARPVRPKKPEALAGADAEGHTSHRKDWCAGLGEISVVEVTVGHSCVLESAGALSQSCFLCQHPHILFFFGHGGRPRGWTFGLIALAT